MEKCEATKTSFHIFPTHKTYWFLKHLQMWHFAYLELDVWT
jgi:hypothetical protein